MNDDMPSSLTGIAVVSYRLMTDECRHVCVQRIYVHIFLLQSHQHNLPTYSATYTALVILDFTYAALSQKSAYINIGQQRSTHNPTGPNYLQTTRYDVA